MASAALIGAACSTAFATTRVVVNPELVNPVVVSSGFLSGAITVSPTPFSGVDPVTPTPPVPPNYLTYITGSVPVFTTPPSEPPEIVVADVQQRMSILYITDPAAKVILGSSTSMRELPWLFRQEPSNSGGDAALAGNGTQRMWKVSGANLAKKPTAAAMASMLKNAVDHTCVTPAGVNTCGAHRVGVDEIGAAFGTAPGESDAGTPGERLKNAMIMLAKQQYAPGESYASRIHFYVAPGVSTSISAGLGTARTLGRNGVELRRDYSQAMAAMSRAGGVWLEMYHYPTRGRARTPFTAAEWRDVPTDFAAFLRQQSPSSRNPLNYLHFVMTETRGSDEPAGQSCVVRPDGGSIPNARRMSIVVDTDLQTVIPTLESLPMCPPAPPVCPVMSPASHGMSLAMGARRLPAVRDLNNQQAPGITRLGRSGLYETILRGGVSLTIFAPTPSSMSCQWLRAQTGDVNTRILANGPAAFKVTGTEAEVYGQMFRQFFIVG